MKQGKNGKWYLDINVWINDQLDQYGNIAGVSVGQTKEEREAKTKRIYIGNLKTPQQQQPAAPATYPGAPAGYPPATPGAQQSGPAGYAPAQPAQAPAYAPATTAAGYAPPASGYTPQANGGKPPF